MDVNGKARDLQEQAARTSHVRKLGTGYSWGDWRDSLTGPCAPTPDELELLQSQVAGHRWDGWRRLTGDEDYFAACSCGWRSSETVAVGPMLCQAKEHLAAVRHTRDGRPPTRAPARDEGERDASQREIRPDERVRELCAAVDGQQRRLSQSPRHSTDLLSASADQADRLVAALERGEWAKTRASAPSAATVQRKVERARELRKAIVAAAAALAAIAEEMAWIDQDPETRCPGGAAQSQRMAGEGSETAGTARQAGAHVQSLIPACSGSGQATGPARAQRGHLGSQRAVFHGPWPGGQDGRAGPSNRTTARHSP